MWNTKQIGYGLCATFLLAVSGSAYADPIPRDRGGLEERSEEAFEDLDRTLDPSSVEKPNTEGVKDAPSNGLTEEAQAAVESETVVTTTETNGRNAQSTVNKPYEPSQKELYERLLREETAGQGYTTEYDDVWVETPTRSAPVPESQTTTVIIEDDEDRRRYRRSGLWYFFHHLITGRPHHVHRDSHRTHRAAKKAKRRARAERRTRRAVAERRAKRDRAERKAKRQRAERKAKRQRAERRARRNEAKRRASRRAAKRQRRANKARANNGRRSRRSR